MNSPDVVIVGAGIVGAACAYRLGQEGLRVTVVEAGIPGAGATAAGMGHVLVLDDSEAQFALTRYSQEGWDALRPQLPAGAEFFACGTLWVAADDEEFGEAARKLAYYTARGVASEILDARALAEAEPNLRPGLRGALRIPGDSTVYAPVAAHWLLANSPNTEVRRNATVLSLEKGVVRLAGGRALPAGLVVNAAGANAGRLSPGIPVRPRKGHLAITDRYPGFLRHALVELGYVKSAHAQDGESVAFNAQPRPTGQVLLGSSRQFDRTSIGVEPDMLARMIERGFAYMPGLRQLSTIRTWTGFRAATPDGLPLIGPWPRQAGVWLATGHEGLGITTALGTAGILAALIFGREPPIPAGAYSPARF